MKKFKIQLSPFDIGMIAAFVVIGILGGGAWWYLSGQLQAAQDQCKAGATEYTSLAVKSGIIVSPANTKTLQANDDLLKEQVDPLFSADLLPKDNGLAAVRGEDPVAWKHDLDDDVKTLISDANSRSVTLPKTGFYFGFTRYLTESPSDAATSVLTKQRMAIKTIAEIMINASVKTIKRVRRTYEEDPHKAGAPQPNDDRTEGDQLGGYAVNVSDDYTAYPFEFEFDSTPEALRPVIDNLLKSPYLFVVRRVEVHNDKLTSPTVDDLSRMSGGNGTAAPTFNNSSPGEVAASTTPTVGPQYLFGKSLLHVKMRVDLIEWNPDVKSLDGPEKK